MKTILSFKMRVYTLQMLGMLCCERFECFFSFSFFFFLYLETALT